MKVLKGDLKLTAEGYVDPKKEENWYSKWDEGLVGQRTEVHNSVWTQCWFEIGQHQKVEQKGLSFVSKEEGSVLIL